MRDLRARGYALLGPATEQRVIGRFLAADAFYPFWVQFRRDPSPEDIASAEASAKRALEIADTLSDPDLASLALDAIAAAATSIDDFARARELTEQRIAFEDKLALYERLDAHSMIAWMSYLMGDLATAERDSAAMVARLMPGQASYAALHLYAWRAMVLFTLGRWDEAAAMFWRCVEAWHDAGSHAAGYALRGLGVGLDIGHARGDARLVGAATDAFESILSRFPSDSHNQMWLAYMQGEPAFTDRDLYLHGKTPPETVERRLSLACDRREVLSQYILDGVLEKAIRTRVPLVEAQARRARALANHDVSEMTAAIEIWERIGAVPQLGRGKAERGLLSGDPVETDAGLAMLKKLGDVNYLDRFAARV
jgi:tetratricopeptide (TPR) repeat protein